MTITTDLAAPPARAARYRDARRILEIAEGGLPFPAISQRGASFFFTGAPDGASARQAIADAETVLGYAFGVKFEDVRPREMGSTRHVIRTAKLPSGMLLELSILAEHYDGQDARKPVAA